jgi:hypothetical protein
MAATPFRSSNANVGNLENHMTAKILCVSLLFVVGIQAQEPAVPHVTYYSGIAREVSGMPRTGMAEITFALYENQQGGTALWTETQNIPLDDQGRYTVLLGATRPYGLPQRLFSSGKARWLGARLQTPGGTEQPRVPLVGVPYAMKAADADTLGGLPASAYLQLTSMAGTSGIQPDAAQADSPDAACTKIASDGKAGASQLTKFTAACKIEPSAIFESDGRVGIGTSTPAATLDVNGTAAAEGSWTIEATGAATATTGANSNSVDLLAASFNSSSSASIGQHFRWQAEPAGNDTAVPSSTLNLLYATAPGIPAETGLSIDNSGQITFAPGQTFSGAGVSNIANLAAGTGLSGGGITGNITIANTGVLALTAGAGITSSGGNSPILSLDTGFTDGRYLQPAGGALTGPVNLPTNGLALTGNQLALAGGDVGIGTATPGAPLEVAGNMKISGTGSALTFPDGTTQTTAAITGTAGLVAVNRQQVALIKWFPAYQSAVFQTGNNPTAVAFDGANLWVASTGPSGNVTKLRASDGANLGTFAVGVLPEGIAFDGANIWVANTAVKSITKLLASSGATVGTYSVGGYPQGVAFDGTNIWVTTSAGTVEKLLAATGAVVGTYAVGNTPRSLAFDGANIWVANFADNTVTELLASTGGLQGTYSVGGAPAGIAFDGANMWVLNTGDHTVTKLRASDGVTLGTFSVGNTSVSHSYPSGVAFDGANIWVSNYSDDTVTRLRASDGACVGTCTFSVGGGPLGIAFDGTSIWVANSGSNNVSKL